MAFFDINFNKQAYELLPPDKRSGNTLIFLKSLFEGALSFVHKFVLQWYRQGNDAAEYVSGPYSYGESVKYKNHIYMAIPTGGLTSTDPEYPPVADGEWLLVLENWIGVEERKMYEDKKLMLEWALNRWFGTAFRNPPAISDTYIEVVEMPATIFRVGAVESISSVVVSNDSSDYVFATESFGIAYNFIIWMDHHIFDALGPDDPTREKVVRAFADKYVAAGLRYIVNTY